MRNCDASDCPLHTLTSRRQTVEVEVPTAQRGSRTSGLDATATMWAADRRLPVEQRAQKVCIVLQLGVLLPVEQLNVRQLGEVV